MLRDALKSADYFERYLGYQDARIQKFTQVLNNLPDHAEMQRKQCSTYLANFYKDKLSAMYSFGSTKTELLSTFNFYIKYIKGASSINYADLSDILAMMILFKNVDVSDPKFVLSVTGFDDPFIVLLKQELFPGRTIKLRTNELLYPEQYQEFLSIIEEDDSAQATVQLLDYVNHRWYANCQDMPWFESHKSSENTYCGYWCWIAAAIAKMKHLDIAFIRTCKYIPWELLKEK